MATQFTVRSFGHKHGLELKSVRRPRRRRHFESVRDGFIVFALLSDPEVIVMELIVKFKLGSAAGMPNLVHRPRAQ